MRFQIHFTTANNKHWIEGLGIVFRGGDSYQQVWGAHVLNVKLWGCGNEMILWGLSPPNLKSGRA